MARTKPNEILTLGLAGALSGFWTCASGRFLELFGSASQNLALFVGAIFGLVLVAYWSIFRGFRSVWRSVGFVAASTVAYASALVAGIKTPISLNFLVPLVRDNLSRELAICLTGGIVGGAILFVAVPVLLPNRTRWRVPALHALGFPFLSGVLGMIGWLLGPSLGTIFWHLLKLIHLAEQYQYHQAQPSGGSSNYYSLFLVWQSGTAILIGFFLSKHAAFVRDVESAKEEHEKSPGFALAKSQVVSILFLICVAASLGYFIRGQMQVRRAQEAYSKRAREVRERALAEAPSMENLPAVAPHDAEQMLVLKSIASASSGQPPITASPGQIYPPDVGPSLPPFVLYSVNYYKAESTSATSQLIVAATVTDYPNPARGRNTNCGVFPSTTLPSTSRTKFLPS